MQTKNMFDSVVSAAGAEVLLAGAARPGGGAGGRYRGCQQSAPGGKCLNSPDTRLTIHCAPLQTVPASMIVCPKLEGHPLLSMKDPEDIKVEQHITH